MTDTHTYRPSKEFREHLELEVRRRFRRNERLRNAPSRSARWAKAAAVVGISVAIGATAGFASAQIRQNSGRDSLLAAAQAEAMLAKLRADVSRARADDVSMKFRAGVVDQQEVDNAVADLTEMESRRNRAGLNIEEIMASGRAPSDDLNAPLVGGKDYVKMRIEVGAMAAQMRLRVAEENLANADRRARLGAGSDASSTTRVEVARARADMSVLAEKLKLRAEFLQRGTPMTDLAQRLERAQANADALVAQEELRTAKARLEIVQKRRSAGLADDVELLRAQLDVKEREVELQRVALRMKRF